MSFLDKATPVQTNTPSFIAKATPVESTGRKVAGVVAPSTQEFSDYLRASSRLKSGEIAEMQKEREALVASGDPTTKTRIAQIDKDIADVVSKADKTFGQKLGMAAGTGIEMSGVAELGALATGVGRYGLRKVLGKAASEVTPKAVYTPFAENKAAQFINRATTIAPKTAVEEQAFSNAPLISKVKSIGKDTLKMLPESAGFGYGYDVTSGLRNNEGTDALIPGQATAMGVALPLGIGGIRTGKNVIVPSRAKAIDSLEQTYTDLMSGTTPGKKKVSKIEQKVENMNKAGTEGKTPQRVLAEQGIIPNRSGTKLDTFDQANEYRQSFSHLKEANKQALEQVGLSSQLIKLDDLESDAIKYANSQRNIDSGRAPKMVKEIQTEFDNLRKAYPEGVIPIGKVDEIKSARWDNVFGNKGLIDSDVLKKDSEYAIAKSMQKNIEEVATLSGNPDVAQLNREIGDRLEAARYLEELDGKTIKGGRLLKYITTGIGSSLGQTIPGKIIGALGGNIAGEMIIAANVSNPIKRLMLRNLEAKDPEAYIRTVEWLRKQKLDSETRLLLPAPRSIPMGGKDIKGNIVSPSGSKVATPLDFSGATENNIRQGLQQKKNTLLLPAPSNRIITPNTQGTPNPLGRAYKAQEIGDVGGTRQRLSKELPYEKSPSNAQTTSAIINDTTIHKSIPSKNSYVKEVPTSIDGLDKKDQEAVHNWLIKQPDEAKRQLYKATKEGLDYYNAMYERGIEKYNSLIKYIEGGKGNKNGVLPEAGVTGGKNSNGRSMREFIMVKNKDGKYTRKEANPIKFQKQGDLILEENGFKSKEDAQDFIDQFNETIAQRKKFQEDERKLRGNTPGYNNAYGVVAGLQPTYDDKGNINGMKFDPKMAMAGVALGSVAPKFNRDSAGKFAKVDAIKAVENIMKKPFTNNVNEELVSHIRILKDPKSTPFDKSYSRDLSAHILKTHGLFDFEGKLTKADDEIITQIADKAGEFSDELASRAAGVAEDTVTQDMMKERMGMFPKKK